MTRIHDQVVGRILGWDRLQPRADGQVKRYVRPEISQITRDCHGLPPPTAMLTDALSESFSDERVLVIRMLTSENM